MNNKKTVLVYIPTDEEKQELDRIAQDVITFITNEIGTNEKNRLGKIAFIVENLYKSFRDSIRK